MECKATLNKINEMKVDKLDARKRYLKNQKH